VDPNVIILAGPNGAGKSTAAPDLLHGALHIDEFVNADLIARGISAFHRRVLRSTPAGSCSPACMSLGASARI